MVTELAVLDVYKAIQSMWAHPEHRQDAVAASGIEVVVHWQLQHRLRKVLQTKFADW